MKTYRVCNKAYTEVEEFRAESMAAAREIAKNITFDGQPYKRLWEFQDPQKFIDAFAKVDAAIGND